ncbi:hypothetical protein WDZ16_01155 [Pseudokineococcus marinus]|uniref:hypothetical protein n=1 Tax=Pseudokineococcus marinus TaxID=351215 RepID=UPI0030A349D9
MRRAVLAGLAGAVLVPLLATAPATASTTTARDQVDVLRVTSTVDPDALSRLAPGEHVDWRIVADIEGAPEGELSLRLLARGALVDHERGLRTTLRTCAVPWDGVVPGLRPPTAPVPTCRSGEMLLLQDVPLADVPETLTLPARTITPAQGERILFTVVLPENAPDELQGADSFLGVGVTAVGDELDPVPGDGPTPGPTPTPLPDPGPTTGPGPGTPGTPGDPGGVPGTTGGAPGTTGGVPGAPGGTSGGALPLGASTGDAGLLPLSRSGARTDAAGTTTGATSLSLPQRLARTGADALPAAAAAAAAVAVGLLLGRVARTRTRRRTP